MIRNQTILPRYSVLPMNDASCANTRFDVPESPCWLRSPRNASASSMITPTGHIACSTFRIFSRLPSVTPCHCERKFRNFTHGKPISPVKQLTRNVLAEPTGPAIR